MKQSKSILIEDFGAMSFIGECDTFCVEIKQVVSLLIF